MTQTDLKNKLIMEEMQLKLQFDELEKDKKKLENKSVGHNYIL